MFENYSEVVVLLVKALQHELTVEEEARVRAWREECEENELMDSLQSGRFDLVIARDSMISPQKYHFVPLAKDRLCVMLPHRSSACRKIFPDNR